MILGIGTDIVDVARIAQVLRTRGPRFLARCFHPTEHKYPPDHPAAPSHYAKRFAAKEAAAKALRTGVRGGLLLRDMAVINDAAGAPVLVFHGAAHKHLLALPPSGPKNLHLSLSDERGHAIAFVVIESLPGA